MEQFLQTEPWARFQESLGKVVHRAAQPEYRFVAVEEKTALGRYLYVPYGPVASGPEGFDAALAALTALARSRGAAYVRIEPVSAGISADAAEQLLAGRGLVRAPKNLQPDLTWLIDIARDPDAVLADMRSSNRNIHRNIHKKGVSFSVSRDPADIGILLGFLHETAARTGFRPQPDSYLRQAAQTLMPLGAASLHLAWLDGQPIAAALAYDSSDTRTYAHAAASFEHRRLNAGVPLLVNLILDAAAAGLQTVDLWGIAPDDDPEHEWAGFTKFKKSFGGRAAAYPGTWDLPVNRAAYRAYRLARAGAGFAVRAKGRLRDLAGRVRKAARRSPDAD